MSNTEFRVDSFRFKEFISQQFRVACEVEWDGPFDQAIPKEEVEKLLDDLGKWEALAKTISDLNLTSVPSSGTGNFGRGLYTIAVQGSKRAIGPSKVANVAFRLTEEEALRRTGGKDTVAPLDPAEITSQIQNLPKWRNFTTAVKHLKETQSSVS
jgi:hypothetical protein